MTIIETVEIVDPSLGSPPETPIPTKKPKKKWMNWWQRKKLREQQPGYVPPPPKKRKPRKKKRGRKKQRKLKQYRTKKGWKGEFPTYEEAKVLVRARGITSSIKYFQYYDKHKPVFLSRFPYNLYRLRGWISWNDFLGTTNVFNNPKEVLLAKTPKTYWESVRQLQPMKISGVTEYRRMIRAGELTGFSLYPENRYKEEWTGWPNYLGKNVQLKIEMAAKSKPLWVIVHTPEDPDNVVWFLKISSEDILKEQIKPGWKILAKYEYEEELYTKVWEIIEKNSNFHFDKEQRLCNNVNQLMWELSSILLLIR